MRDRQGVRKREKGREELGVADKRIVRKAKMRKIGTERERERQDERDTQKRRTSEDIKPESEVVPCLRQLFKSKIFLNT